MEGTERTATPWHLWVIGALSLLWNAGGAYDYVMTQSRNMDYLQMAADNAEVPLEMVLDYFGGFPAWADMFWALGVWGAVGGSLLLLLRSRFAFHAFIASIIGIAGTTVYSVTSDMPDELSSPFAIFFSAAIVIVTLALAFYAKKQTSAGVLR